MISPDRPCSVEIADVHDFPLGAEDVREAALVRHALHDRQLTALEAAANSGPGAGLLALGAAAGCLAVAAAGTPTDALLAFLRTLVGNEI